ncbi:MAG TPA: c-type cytochrome [Puia sp.]|nr:c-type cytochrome [Puia sp.]
MLLNNRSLVTAALVILVAIGSIAATSTAPVTATSVTPATTPVTAPNGEYTNLKVLPKDISSKTLQSIMIDDFEDGLGVGCGFCHAEQKGSHKLDYASDAKPEKLIARNMIRMTLKLNAKYFQVHRPGLGSSGLVVTCTTCHQGKPRPGE